MRVLITDDEPPARARLRQMLRDEPDVEIAGEAGNGDEAIEAALTLRPDVIFLDVAMPDRDGVAVLRQLRATTSPIVIFTTAHIEPAIEAFALEATDYLLKPFSRARLAAALERIRRRLAAAGPTASTSLDRFLVKTGKSYRVVPADEIISLQAAANYIVLRTKDGKHILRRTLRQFEAELCPRKFCRTSRSTIANLDAVREIKTNASGAHLVVLSDGSDLPLTVNLREFEARLNLAV